MTTSYDTDIVAWANEQAHYIRTGSFDKLDIEHLAEEIEDVGKSEQRELASRMAILLAHLIKWHFQPAMRGTSWSRTIKLQRIGVVDRLHETPSLKPKLTDAKWLRSVWDDALTIAIKETGLDNFPESCPWSITEVLTDTWLPD